jgi:hypothetical protein
MPILTETTHLRKRHAPVWLLILAVVVLPLVGLFAWSFYQPVILSYQMSGIAFGRISKEALRPPRSLKPNYFWVDFKLPGGKETGWYAAGWIWL